MKAHVGEPVVLPRELARRVSTTVEVWDAASEETIVFAVPPDRALEAFYHPFAQLTAPLGDLVPAADA